MSYGGSLSDGYRLAGLYAGRILKRRKACRVAGPPTKGSRRYRCPDLLLARADEVIE